jgi:hypothetical protein
MAVFYIKTIKNVRKVLKVRALQSAGERVVPIYIYI